MNEHDIKKYIKLLKKYNSGDCTFDDVQELKEYSSEFYNHIGYVLADWDENYD